MNLKNYNNKNLPRICCACRNDLWIGVFENMTKIYALFIYFLSRMCNKRIIIALRARTRFPTERRRWPLLCRWSGCECAFIAFNPGAPERTIGHTCAGVVLGIIVCKSTQVFAPHRLQLYIIQQMCVPVHKKRTHVYYAMLIAYI